MGDRLIKVRFDRMKNISIQSLCSAILRYIKTLDGDALQLTKAFHRFEEYSPLLKNLNPKQRKLLHSDDIAKQRKKLDDLVTSLLLHIKALERADFDDQREEIKMIFDFTRSYFKNYIHMGLKSKKGLMDSFFYELNLNETKYNAYQHLGLMRYVDAFVSIGQQIKETNEHLKGDKSKQPEVGITIPSKEKIIEELRFLLQTIDVTSRSNPEIDYNPMIRILNVMLIESRTQLRNTTTRRKVAKAKAEKKKESDEGALTGSSI
ncbi:MAG: hypothetical protein WCG93_09465 [Paludibacter sp.]